ncbi:MAG TPA: anti-sigma factor [Gemmatimonadales bacterium]|nr:anti-sigma factor [Gemmatimonadales bacterium]
MRHIPDDELHAYLDQGLSRTQCVEIESHLAACPSCQATRDGIAALRDRTTALLARLAPPRSFAPAFDTLRERAADLVQQRRRRLHVAAWAASLVAAVGLGWGASSMVRSERRSEPDARVAIAAPLQPAPAARELPPALETSRPQVATAAVPKPRPPRPKSVGRPTVVSAAAPGPVPPAAAEERRNAALAVLDPTPALELTRLQRPNEQSEPELGGMWRTMSWDGAKAEAGERVPHIDGLPVMQVQVQNGEQGTRPVMVVKQQLSSGQVIRTIEGPATDVSQLLSRRAMADVDSLFITRDSNRLGSSEAGHAMAMQVGDRMLAITGDLPSDSLRAMIRRLNAEMRSK